LLGSLELVLAQEVLRDIEPGLALRDAVLVMDLEASAQKHEQ
jgi:hypothetical protein